MIARRTLLTSLTGLTAAAAIAPASAVRAMERFDLVQLRGGFEDGLGGSLEGLRAGALDDQSGAFQRLLDQAAAERRPIFLPAGRYVVSDVQLPDGTRLSGVPGATQIVYGGSGRFLRAENAERIDLSGLVIDGDNRWLGDDSQATLEARNVAQVNLTDCEFRGSRRNALVLERCGGRITRNRLSGAADMGLYAVESSGLTITDNHVFVCGNGGILVHRWSEGPDNSIVTGNRVQRIRSDAGGTGQTGNGINIFRAGNVMVANNHVSDCAFSAIRSNSGSNVQIVGNQCLGSGETAVYSEFAFEGAIIANNLIDGGANGISIANFNEGGRLSTVTGNIVRNIVAPGPYEAIGPGFGWGIAVEADTAVNANTIERVSKWGMLLGWGPYLRNVAATGNIVRDVPVGVAVSVVESAQAALISDNIFEGAPGGAVVGFRWGEPATVDLTAHGLPESAAHLTIERNTVL
jgi:uncharacterized secreted repeat protein (TIGR03808 family)